MLYRLYNRHRASWSFFGYGGSWCWCTTREGSARLTKYPLREHRDMRAWATRPHARSPPHYTATATAMYNTNRAIWARERAWEKRRRSAYEDAATDRESARTAWHLNDGTRTHTLEHTAHAQRTHRDRAATRDPSTIDTAGHFS